MFKARQLCEVKQHCYCSSNELLLQFSDIKDDKTFHEMKNFKRTFAMTKVGKAKMQLLAENYVKIDTNTISQVKEFGCHRKYQPRDCKMASAIYLLGTQKHLHLNECHHRMNIMKLNSNTISKVAEDDELLLSLTPKHPQENNGN
uniref:Uncharacterized protein n=1 Tax=Onchocerca volvulus TaxID=6282 RepID=A0A8R1XXV4_ONCVO